MKRGIMIQMAGCEVCGRELEDNEVHEELVWNEALTLCDDCEALVNRMVVSRSQIQKGR